jgi:multidrug efflux system membrane fusion protein
MTGKPRRVISLISLMLVLSGAAFYSYRTFMDASDGGRPAGRAPAPVSVTFAARQDVPVYLTGLGTVQAMLTIGIHSQIDGKLQEASFAEGQ